MISSNPLPESVLESVEYHAAQRSTLVTLRQLYDYTAKEDDLSFLRSAQFLRKEMPIRLARKVKELEDIPGGLSRIPNIRAVRDWYIKSFRELSESPYPETLAQEKQFTEIVSVIKDRHRNQVPVMARGIREYIEKEDLDGLDEDLQGFLNSFYLSRIGIRVLLGHYVACHSHRDGWVGIINSHTSPHEVAMEAAKAAGDMCRQTLGDPPPIHFHGRIDFKFRYIASHLFHMLFELLKNSFRATIEQHRNKSRLPGVHVIIAGGSEDVSIKISDHGGGIPRSGLERIWTYGYTTANLREVTYGSDEPVIAGLGYGLPMSRLYARYFGGDLQVVSLEGYGTDAFIHLSRLGTTREYIL